MSLFAKGLCNLAASSNAEVTKFPDAGPLYKKGSYRLGMDETKCLYTFFVTSLDANAGKAANLKINAENRGL